MMKTVIVYGPPASGKTVNGEALCQMYGCQGINDQGKVPHHRFHFKHGYLNLVIERPYLVPVDSIVVPIQDALAQLKRTK